MRLLERESGEVETVDELCGGLGVSAGHLQKTFRAVLGIGPKEVMDMMRIDNFKETVRGTDVTTSLYESGFGSSRSLYEKAGERLGMTPAVYKKGGKGMRLNYTVADSPLGKLMVAATEKGICSVSFGESEEELRSELENEFFAAEIGYNDASLKQAVTAILRSLEGETTILALPFDLRASAFQMRVWSELRKIPYGETRSYAQIADAIGSPKAVRTVARACRNQPGGSRQPLSPRDRLGRETERVQVGHRAEGEVVSERKRGFKSLNHKSLITSSFGSFTFLVRRSGMIGFFQWIVDSFQWIVPEAIHYPLQTIH